MIEVKHLYKSFGGLQALTDVSFEVGKGHILGFLGANGAGKTTTMDILCGCIGPDSGTARICGFDITEDPVAAKANLGYLPDVPPLYSDMTVWESLQFSGRIHHLAGMRLQERTELMVEKFNLQEVVHRLVGNLSKGFRQRVAFAQSMIHDPSVLVLDEPTEGLDPNQIIQIREIISELKNDYTIMLSSHILSEVENTCDSIIIINRGKIVRRGTYLELVESIGRTKSIELKVKDHSRDLLADLHQLASINEVNFDAAHDKFAISLLEEDESEAIEDIAKLVIDRGYGLRSINPMQQNLEEVFFQSTKN